MASSSQTVNVYQRVGPVLRDLPGFSEMILCLFLLANPPIIFHFFWKTCWKIILVDSPWWKNPIRKSPDLEQIQFFGDFSTGLDHHFAQDVTPEQAMDYVLGCAMHAMGCWKAETKNGAKRWLSLIEWGCTLWQTNIAMENHNFQWVNPL